MKLSEFLKVKPPSESEEQKRVVGWLQAAKVPHFAVPNGGARDGRYAKRLKLEGVVSGVPDLIIVKPSPRTGQSVALEMKSLKGKLSDNQKIFIPKMEKQGWIVLIGYGADDAIRQLRKEGY